MFRRLWRKFLLLLFAVVTVATILSSGWVHADDQSMETLKAQFEKQQQQIEKQQKQIEELKTILGLVVAPAPDKPAVDKALPPMDQKTVEKIVGDILKIRDDQAK